MLIRVASPLLQIRFFERVKLERQLRRLEAQLAEAGAQGNEGGTAYALQQQVQQLTQDLQYVKHFPKGEKYVSLLREADTPEAQVLLGCLLQPLVLRRCRCCA